MSVDFSSLESLVTGAGSAADWSAVVIACVAVFIAVWQARTQRRAAELQIAENVFRHIRELQLAVEQHISEVEYDTARKLHRAPEPGNPLEGAVLRYTSAKSRAEQLFSSVEYLAILVNHRHITARELTVYFGSLVPHWYESILPKSLPAQQESNAYPELKKWHERLKRGN